MLIVAGKAVLNTTSCHTEDENFDSIKWITGNWLFSVHHELYHYYHYPSVLSDHCRHVHCISTRLPLTWSVCVHLCVCGVSESLCVHGALVQDCFMSYLKILHAVTFAPFCSSDSATNQWQMKYTTFLLFCHMHFIRFKPNNSIRCTSDQSFFIQTECHPSWPSRILKLDTSELELVTHILEPATMVTCVLELAACMLELAIA